MVENTILPLSETILFPLQRLILIDINPVHEIITAFFFCQVFEITNRCTGHKMQTLPLCFKTLKNKHSCFVLHIIQLIIQVSLS